MRGTPGPRLLTSDVPFRSDSDAAPVPEPSYAWTKRGYTIREDLVLELRVIAIESDKKLPELMSQAFEMFINAMQSNIPAGSRTSPLPDYRAAPEPTGETLIRKNRGYSVREDQLRQLRHLALRQHRRMYQVMEDALSFFLEQRARQSH